VVYTYVKFSGFPSQKFSEERRIEFPEEVGGDTPDIFPKCPQLVLNYEDSFRSGRWYAGNTQKPVAD
jgi:hypothetical protein